MSFDAPIVRDMLCYIIRDYDHSDGRTVLLKRGKEDSTVLIGDRKCVLLDIPKDEKAQQLLRIIPSIYKIMRHIGLQQAQYYFSNDLTLTDVRISANKFLGPGMLRDVFAKSVTTQDVIHITPLDDTAIQAMTTGAYPYNGDLIIKPSRFREADANPLYLRFSR